MSITWSAQDDASIRENYDIYRDLHSVFEILSNFLDGGKHPQAVAERLYELQVIDRGRLLTDFPSSQVHLSGTAGDIDAIISPDMQESDVKEWVENVLESKRENEHKWDALEWVKKRIQESLAQRTDLMPVSGVTLPDVDYIIVPSKKEDFEILASYTSTHLLMTSLQFDYRMTNPDTKKFGSEQPQFWVIPGTLNSAYLRHAITLIEKTQQQWKKEQEEKKAKDAQEIINEVLGQDRKKVYPWMSPAPSNITSTTTSVTATTPKTTASPSTTGTPSTPKNSKTSSHSKKPQSKKSSSKVRTDVNTPTSDSSKSSSSSNSSGKRSIKRKLFESDNLSSTNPATPQTKLTNFFAQTGQPKELNKKQTTDNIVTRAPITPTTTPTKTITNNNNNNNNNDSKNNSNSDSSDDESQDELDEIFSSKRRKPILTSTTKTAVTAASLFDANTTSGSAFFTNFGFSFDDDNESA